MKCSHAFAEKVHTSCLIFFPSPCSAFVLKNSGWILKRKWICPSSSTLTPSSQRTPKWPKLIQSPSHTPFLKQRRDSTCRSLAISDGQSLPGLTPAPWLPPVKLFFYNKKSCRSTVRHDTIIKLLRAHAAAMEACVSYLSLYSWNVTS